MALDRNAYFREYRAKNREKLLQQAQFRKTAGPGEIRSYNKTGSTKDRAEYLREYRAKNKERLAEQKRLYYIENKERIQNYKESNSKQIAERTRAYNQANRENHRGRKLDYQRRYREGKTQRLAHNLRNRLSKFIRRSSGRASTEKILGCSFKEFTVYIERQFTRAMNWENYGRAWHIDHIIPCAAFDLTDPAQAARCFHFSNLRPLKAVDNLRKNAKIVDPQLRLLL